MTSMKFATGKTIHVKFSEFLEDDKENLFIDYPSLDSVPVEVELSFYDSELILRVVETAVEDEGVLCLVVQ
jgi:hypothetical protein